MAASMKKTQDSSSYILAQSAVPLIMLPSGTNISATGAISPLTNSLPSTPSGVVRVYCFAQAGLAAGMYYATFTSPSSLQLYLDAAATVTPTGITPGSYVGGTTEVVLASVTVPGGSLGPNGQLRFDCLLNWFNSANTKTLNIKLAGQQIGGFSPTTSASGGARYSMRNRGTNRQVVGFPNGSYDWVTARSGSTYTLTVDTTVDQVFTITGVLQSLAEWFIIEGYTVEVLPG